MCRPLIPIKICLWYCRKLSLSLLSKVLTCLVTYNTLCSFSTIFSKLWQLFSEVRFQVLFVEPKNFCWWCFSTHFWWIMQLFEATYCLLLIFYWVISSTFTFMLPSLLNMWKYWFGLVNVDLDWFLLWSRLVNVGLDGLNIKRYELILVRISQCWVKYWLRLTNINWCSDQIILTNYQLILTSYLLRMAKTEYALSLSQC